MTEPVAGLPVDPELARLISLLCVGDLTEADKQTLMVLLAGSAAAREHYVYHLSMHAELMWRFGGERTAALPAGKPPGRPDARSPVLSFLSSVIRMVPGGDVIVGGLVLFAVIGALWGVVFCIQYIQTDHRSDVAAAGLNVGTLVTAAQARWSPKSLPPTDANVQVGRRYELAAGWAELELSGGTRVVVEGPAVWKFASEERLQIESGKLVARVSPAGIGFTVVTPTVEVIDLGTEFGVEVDAAGKTDVHVLKGAVEVIPADADAASGPTAQKLVAGQAIRISGDGRTTASIPLNRARFANVRSDQPRQSAAGANAFEPSQPIWLGNLFDDRPRTSLTAAMQTDAFGAEADFNDLGVDRVQYGGESRKEIAPGIWFDLTSLGWESLYVGRVANDAFPAFDSPGSYGGIRLSGVRMGMDAPRLEEGICEFADALITFHLDDIRAAGRLEERGFEFVCDRAGVNDTCMRDKRGSVHLAVLVSTQAGVRAAVVDGKPARLAKQALSRRDHWSVDSAIGAPLTGDGRFVSFRVEVEPSDKYLTLVATSAGDGILADHSVWIGARLEVEN